MGERRRAAVGVVLGVLCVQVLVTGELRRAALAATPPPATSPTPARDADLQRRLRAAWQQRAGGAAPRTSHLNPDGSPRYINRLVLQSSPYLQQHAFNPVNWYPWGDEAFAAARRENKPIFLSIGYATCHWCHVMERECFENETIAALLNAHFIAIKVDREERPDIDAVYVAAVERLTGSAGWPLSVFLTPDGQPFYGGTYFPPEDRGGLPGFAKVLRTLAAAWTTKHDEVIAASAALTAALQRPPAVVATAPVSVDLLHAAYRQLRQGFDAANGGFGHAPKFPQAHMLQFLLRYQQRTGDADARRMVEETLDHMNRGGIHDQLGGGFHRYATDAQWRVPHYEKMLYDQAINARVYLEAAQATGASGYAEVARDIFGYVRRDLTAPEGGFYAAEDADSEGEEGRFYTWSRPEMVAVLGAQRGALIADYYGVTDDTRRPLSVPVPLAAFASRRGLDAGRFATTLAGARAALLAARNQRPRPLRDEEIITGWNGLMIASLAYGSTVLGDPRDAAAAERGARFVLANLQRNGRLLRSWRGEPSKTPGYLEDYAFFVWGLEELYAATFDPRWLREADRLGREMVGLFGGAHNGGLRAQASDHEALIAPVEDAEDAALPSGQSVAALVLARLGHLTMNSAFDARARAVVTAYAHDLRTAPTAHTEMLTALDFLLGPTKEIVIAGPADATGTQALLAVARRHYLPRAVAALHAPNDTAAEALVPYLTEQPMRGGRPTAYVCEQYVCKLPTHDPATLERQLTEARPRPEAVQPRSE